MCMPHGCALARSTGSRAQGRASSAAPICGSGGWGECPWRRPGRGGAWAGSPRLLAAVRWRGARCWWRPGGACSTAAGAGARNGARRRWPRLEPEVVCASRGGGGRCGHFRWRWRARARGTSRPRLRGGRGAAATLVQACGGRRAEPPPPFSPLAGGDHAARRRQCTRPRPWQNSDRGSPSHRCLLQPPESVAFI